MNVEILGQEIIDDLRAPDLTDTSRDWSKLGTLDLGQINVVRDLPKVVRDHPERAADSFVVFGDDVQPDAWAIKTIPDLPRGFSRMDKPIVELLNLAVPDYTAAIRVTPALALDMERGSALTGVARAFRRVLPGKAITIQKDPSLKGPVQKVMVPVLRLHCPKQIGCLASEEYAVEKGAKVEAKLALAAVGAAGANSTSLRWSSRWDTRDGECLQYLLPAEIFTEYGIILYKGKPFKFNGLMSWTSLRFVEDDPQREARQEAIPPTEDGCQQPAGAIQYDRRLTKREGIDAGTKGLSFNAVSNARGTLSLGLAQPGWPSFTFNYERTVTTTFTRAVTLAPKASYLAYTAEPPADSDRPEHAEILWTTL